MSFQEVVAEEWEVVVVVEVVENEVVVDQPALE